MFNWSTTIQITARSFSSTALLFIVRIGVRQGRLTVEFLKKDLEDLDRYRFKSIKYAYSLLDY